MLKIEFLTPNLYSVPDNLASCVASYTIYNTFRPVCWEVSTTPSRKIWHARFSSLMPLPAMEPDVSTRRIVSSGMMTDAARSRNSIWSLHKQLQFTATTIDGAARTAASIPLWSRRKFDFLAPDIHDLRH